MKKIIELYEEDTEIKPWVFSKAAREEMREVIEQMNNIIENKIIWRNK